MVGYVTYGICLSLELGLQSGLPDHISTMRTEAIPILEVLFII